jgi:hypothetical protein
MLSRRSISVWPSDVRRSSSTERISDGAVEDVDRRPQQVFEVGFEAGVTQRHHQGVEDVGHRAGDDLCVGHRPRVGFVLERAVAVELEFGEDVIGRG